MNYYPFNVGDYAAHTSHLEPLEDLAYRRMLDIYYLREEPLPASPAAVARLVRMRANLTEVEAVLDEFFKLTPSGWSHTRCDAEISRMQEKLEASDEKDQHEKDRMQRYRERRAAMFAALRERGIVPAYDVAMKDLQRLFDENCSAPATPPETEPETPATPPATHLQRVQPVSGDALATAISTNTNTNTNTSIKEGEGDVPDGPAHPSMAGAICVAMKSVGLNSVNPGHPELQVLIDKGADLGLFVEAAKAAVKKQKPFAYALATVKGQMADAAAMASEALARPVITGNSETAYQRSMRLRVAEVSPLLARPAPGAPPVINATDYFQNIPAIEVTK